MNKLIGMIGTTAGGGLIGAGIQHTYDRNIRVGSKIMSELSKLSGKSGFKLDNTSLTLLLCGIAVLIVGVYFSTQKK